jgi:hypothetical protein
MYGAGEHSSYIDFWGTFGVLLRRFGAVNKLTSYINLSSSLQHDPFSVVSVSQVQVKAMTG